MAVPNPAPSQQGYYETGRSALAFARPDLPINDGDVTDADVQVGAAMADRVTGEFAGELVALTLDGSKGARLTRLAHDKFNTDRVLATKAIGQVTLTRAPAGPLDSIPAGAVIATVPDALGKNVSVLADGTTAVGAGVTSVTVAATAVAAGRAGNIARISQWQLYSTLLSTYAPSNADAFVGGDEDESDADLVRRCRTASDQVGTVPALEYRTKKAVPTAKSATAVEDQDTGLLTLFVADADGNSNPAMVAAVLAALPSYKAAGTKVILAQGVLLSVDIQIALSVRVGWDTQANVARVQAACKDAWARNKAGELIDYRDAIKQAALNVDPDNVRSCSVILPPANPVPDANQIIRAGNVTVA